MRFRTVNTRKVVKYSKEHDGSPSCVLPAVLRVPKFVCSHVFLPEFTRLLAAAQRALPHVPVLCNREGVVRINQRVGGARSSTANSFSSTTPSSCSVFLSNYGRYSVFLWLPWSLSSISCEMNLLYSIYL